VDLDGTLLAGDTLKLSVVGLLSREPWAMLRPVAALLQGRAAFKAEVARRHLLDPATLPWRAAVLSFLGDQRSAGRRLVLATAAHRVIAESVAAYLKLFDAVIASDATNNLKGDLKVRAIRVFTAGGEFDYAGDSWADVPVFAAARRCIVVTRDPRLLARVRAVSWIETVFSE
jgi:phosphoserine phosphatase